MVSSLFIFQSADLHNWVSCIYVINSAVPEPEMTGVNRNSKTCEIIFCLFTKFNILLNILPGFLLGRGIVFPVLLPYSEFLRAKGSVIHTVRHLPPKPANWPGFCSVHDTFTNVSKVPHEQSSAPENMPRWPDDRKTIELQIFKFKLSFVTIVTDMQSHQNCVTQSCCVIGMPYNHGHGAYMSSYITIDQLSFHCFTLHLRLSQMQHGFEMTKW